MEHSNIKMVINILANGFKIKNKEMDCILGWMAIFMMGSIFKAKKMGWAFYSKKMVLNMKANGKMEFNLELENFLI